MMFRLLILLENHTQLRRHQLLLLLLECMMQVLSMFLEKQILLFEELRRHQQLRKSKLIRLM
jgi:hypothetical protein